MGSSPEFNWCIILDSIERENVLKGNNVSENMKRKSIRKTNEKQTSNSLLSEIRSLFVQMFSFIFSVISTVKTSLSLHQGKRKKEDKSIVELIPKDTLAEQASIKAKAAIKQVLCKIKATLILAKDAIKQVLCKIKATLILAKDAIKQELIQAKARRAFNKAARKAGKARRAKEKLKLSNVKEKKALNNAKAEKKSNKTKTKKSADKTKIKKGSTKKKKKQIPLYRRVLSLLIKISIFALGLIIVFGYIFGLSRNQSLNMQPAFQDGDLILYLRTYNSYTANQTIVISYDDKTMLERVIAIAGDTVDITEKGLTINGGLVQESYAWGETTQFENGVTFPLTVPDGKIFVLGDNREHATDSRILGCIDENDVNGSVIGAFRRRNF